MYDTGKVVTGIIIFLALITSPFWLNAGGKSAKDSVPKLEIEEVKKAEKKCVETVEYMRTNHMQMLDKWRDEVVRDGADREFKNDEGMTVQRSLTTMKKSCIGCHKSKKKFCDRCHTYASVKPYCWQCHIAPDEPEGNI